MQVFSPIKQRLSSQIAARQVFSLIKTELELVEAEFERQASSNIQVIEYLGEYLRSSGGKRVRPALTILSACASGGSGRSAGVIRMAAVMEMLHTATLVHDDIIDNAPIRRSEPSLNARFGNQTAVLMGDWLYMSAFETSLEERSLTILDILTRLTRKMTEGELIQLTNLRSLDITEEEYFDILRRKTAYLFSACCEIGAIVGGAEAGVSDALRDYGMNLGIAFQLADDLLDLTADAKALGKAAGADLPEGKMTLPLILLQKADASIRSELERIMQNGDYHDGSRRKLLDQMRSLGTIDAAEKLAYEYADRARKSLEVLSETEYRLALEEIPRYVIERNK